MVRPKKHRCIESLPGAFVYKPAGVPVRSIDWVELNIDEFETIRLLDHLGYDQATAAESMGISRPTVTRIYSSARKKIADALTLGMAIRIKSRDIDNIPAVAATGKGLGCTGFGRGAGRRFRKGQNNEDSSML